MKVKADIDKREVLIVLTEKEANLVFRDIDEGIDSCNFKTTLKLIKLLSDENNILEFIKNAKSKGGKKNAKD